jgi:hypothetical protein
MADTDQDLGHWSNRQFTQVAALIMVVIGFVTADAYSMTAGIAVWSVAVVFLVGSFFIEKDLSGRLPDVEEPGHEPPGQGTT